MATRRHDASRRGVYTYRKNEYDCHINSSRVLELTRGAGRCSNGYYYLSGGAGDVNRCGQLCCQSRLADGFISDETANRKNGVREVALEKKRKFSSISSKDMIVKCCQSESPLTGDSTVTECSEASSSFYQGTSGHDGQERNQLEDGEYVQIRDIFMSRWASDIDSPKYVFESEERKEMTHHKDVCKPMTDVQQFSSPECGEFLREASEENRSICPESVDCLQSPAVNREGYSDDDLINEDGIKIEENHNADIDIGQLDSPSDDENDAYRRKDNTGPKRSINMLQSCRSVFDYQKLNKINEGTYGVVFRAKDKQTGEIVALKMVKLGLEKDGGFPLSFLREINILSSFQHTSIVNLKEVVMGDIDSVFVVMEYMEHDLKAVLDVMKYPFSSSEVKCLMLQLLEGVKYLHDNWVLHRDLKSSNLLFNNSGDLKICDFGMSRQFGSPLKPYTPLVVTLWYRAPELLLGAKQYSTAIDMWSVGCIMAEMLSKEPLFQGKSEVEQLKKIFSTLGTPNEMIWPGLSKLPGASAKFSYQPNNQLRKKFPAASFTGSPILSESGFDLLSKLLAYDPEKRISAEAALDHDWFREVPLPKCKNFMPTFPAQNTVNRQTAVGLIFSLLAFFDKQMVQWLWE